MRLGIKGKQIVGVVTIVGLSVAVLGLLHLTSLAHVGLVESQARGDMLANAIYHRARQAVATRPDPGEALRDDAGLRSILEASVYSTGVTHAAIVSIDGASIVDSDRTREGGRMPRLDDLEPLVAENRLRQLLALYSSGARTLEIRRPLLLNDREFGSIRIGVSMLLVRREVDAAIKPALFTTLLALLVATLVATFFAQLILRPIHVLRAGLTRLGRGEVGVRLDLPKDEFGELGAFFNSLSAQLSADRSKLAGEQAKLESVVAHLEDGVALFNADGDLLFANPAMRACFPAEDSSGRHVADLLPAEHPLRAFVEQTLAKGESQGARAVAFPPADHEGAAAGHGEADGAAGERLVLTHAIHGVDRKLVGVMLVSRNLDYLSRVQTTVNFSQKLMALGRLSAGVAHEVKNPLNAMTIHLELLKQKLGALASARRRSAVGQPGSHAEPGTLPRPGGSGGAGDATDLTSALDHVKVMSDSIRRLDEVLQGFLKFTRPEELKLQRVAVAELVGEVLRIVGAEAQAGGVTVRTEGLETSPDVNGDPAMLRQAFLNLALNACQAMPGGGTLRIFARPARNRRVEIGFEDTGVGIKREHLEKIFNLYFTTRERGSGIGLSMVYRTAQLHDGDVEVESSVGRGTTFRLLLPAA